MITSDFQLNLNYEHIFIVRNLLSPEFLENKKIILRNSVKINQSVAVLPTHSHENLSISRVKRLIFQIWN